MRILMLSTPVGPLGSGIVGGVALTLINLAEELQRRGHYVSIVAPEGSRCNVAPCIGISGRLQPPLQHYGRDYQPIFHEDDVLSNMWAYAATVQTEFDVLLNIAYDALPFMLTPQFSIPIAHFLSMSSQNTALDVAIEAVLADYPGSVSVYSHAQAETYAFKEVLRCLPAGINTVLYTFVTTPNESLAWIGRIAPEKGLEVALEIAQRTQCPLHIMGFLEDALYFERLKLQFPESPFYYEGFLSTAKMQSALGRCQALLMTSQWVEAFGMVVLESMACGVPVIAYNRGGPAEIIIHGKTGWLIDPDQPVDEPQMWATAVARISELSRALCRQVVETDYSLTQMGDRFEAWLTSLMTLKKTPLR